MGYIALGIAGLLVVLFVAVLTGRMAEAKGYSFAVGFVLGMGMSPLLAWIVVMLLPDRGRPDGVSPELRLQIELEVARLKAKERAGS